MPDNARPTLVVNLYAGPGAGKTTCAWEIASELKKRNIVTEYVPEYAKELAWDNRRDLLDGSFEHQSEVLDVQNHRVERLLGKVDVIVTDSPVLLQCLYAKERPEEFEKMAMSHYDAQKNFNLFVERGQHYETEGRLHTLDESKAVDAQVKALLTERGLYHGTYQHKSMGVCVNNICKTLARIQSQPELGHEPVVEKEGVSEMPGQSTEQNVALYINMDNPNRRTPMGFLDTNMKLPVTAETFAEELKFIGITSPEQEYGFGNLLPVRDSQSEEWYQELKSCLPKITPENFDELNFLAGMLNHFSDNDLQRFGHDLFGSEPHGMKEVIRLAQDVGADGKALIFYNGIEDVPAEYRVTPGPMAEQEKGVSQNMAEQNNAQQEFDPGKKIMLEWGQRSQISQHEVQKQFWDDDAQKYKPAVNEDGSPKMVTETRVRLPQQSQYPGFVFTTRDNVFAPHRFKNGEDMGPSATMSGVKVFENASYKITNTPYQMDAQGKPLEENGKKLLDFDNQKVARLTGAELQKEMNAWRQPNREQSQNRAQAAEQAVTVEQFISEHPGDSFDMMTPGGYVVLTPEKAQGVLNGDSVMGYNGISEQGMETTAKELLSQVVSGGGNYDNGTWSFSTEHPKQAAEQDKQPPQQSYKRPEAQAPGDWQPPPPGPQPGMYMPL